MYENRNAACVRMYMQVYMFVKLSWDRMKHVQISYSTEGIVTVVCWFNENMDRFLEVSEEVVGV